MPTTREVEAARVERMRRRAEELAAKAKADAARPRNARERRIAEAHRIATAPARWECKVARCGDPGPHPSSSPAAAEAEAIRHYDNRHATPPPDNLEEQRAAWVRAGRPPLGHFPARRVVTTPPRPLGSRPTTATPPRPPRSAWDDRTEDTWIDKL